MKGVFEGGPLDGQEREVTGVAIYTTIKVLGGDDAASYERISGLGAEPVRYRYLGPREEGDVGPGWPRALEPDDEEPGC